MSEQQTGASRTAVVIGASMGGLLAARALAEHYGQVMLLERDTLPAAGGTAKGRPRVGTPTPCWCAAWISWKATSLG